MPDSAVFEGTCSDGKTYVGVFGLTGGYYFFEDGKLAAVASYSDGLDETCRGRRYWPRKVECPGKTKTRTICGWEGAE